MRRVDRALFVGRFQPFHLGHLEVCKRIADAHERLVVAIGSAEQSHTPANPFTAAERHAMIEAALDEARIARYALVPVPDVNRNAIWVAHVASLVPPFHTLYSNNPLPRRLFAEAGYEVRAATFHDRERFEGTRIRKLMVDDGGWEELVPKAVARVVHEIGGVDRLRMLADEDRARRIS